MEWGEVGERWRQRIVIMMVNYMGRWMDALLYAFIK